MEIIKNYLDNVFQSLPQNNDVLRIKSELYNDMETKYHELINSGKTKNEAIGIVIADFGNIDELVDELGIETINNNTYFTNLSIEIINEFLEASKKAGNLISYGVSLIIISVALFIAFTDLINLNSTNELLNNIPVALLLILIIPAVALFIYAGSLYTPYDYIEKGEFNLNITTKTIIEKEALDYKKTLLKTVIIGVSLCIASPVILILISSIDESLSSIGLGLMLSVLAIAVFIFINYGCVHEAYNKILKREEYALKNIKNKKSEKIIGAVASVVWPLATCIFFITGFIYNAWHINWLIWPITGMLFGAFAAVCSILTNE